MKKKLLIAFALLIGIVLVLAKLNTFQVNQSFKAIAESSNRTFKDGDIIFQTSQSQQCEAVRIATNSKFSHCGIIFIKDGKQYVYEAVQPVKMTLLEDWIEHGKEEKYVVKRLNNASTVLNKNTIEKMMCKF